MSWGFDTDPDFQELLDWTAEFVRTEVEPLDLIIEQPYDLADPVRQRLIPPLQAAVREKNLWACHLGPELGGQGYGQLKLALLNEILGGTTCGPLIFGCQAPDSGNSEILAHYGSDRLKKEYLDPLVAGEIVSCFSMTEPQGGSDPTGFTTSAVPDGDEWVITGQKWFSSHARYAAFLIVMAVTDPDADPHHRQSMFVVPAGSPGLVTEREVGVAFHAGREGAHAYLRYEGVRVPAENMLGPRGEGFAVAQVRLGGGRIHHAMRTVGLVRRAFDMMCERALSRTTRGEQLARKQLVQQMIAESWIQIEQFRLLVLRTAWRIDKYNDYGKVRADISAVKAAMPKVLHDVASRALQVHGSLGVSTEMPLANWVTESFKLAIADGATEVHIVNLARTLLRGRTPSPDLFPTQHLPRREQAARARYAPMLADLDIPWVQETLAGNGR